MEFVDKFILKGKREDDQDEFEALKDNILSRLRSYSIWIALSIKTNYYYN